MTPAEELALSQLRAYRWEPLHEKARAPHTIEPCTLESNPWPEAVQLQDKPRESYTSPPHRWQEWPVINCRCLMVRLTRRQIAQWNRDRRRAKKLAKRPWTTAKEDRKGARK